MAIYALPASSDATPGAVVRPLEGGPPLATVDRTNPLDGSPRGLPGALPRIAWSGWLGAEPGGKGEDPESSFLNWGPRGWSAFDELCGRLAGAGQEVWFRPRAGHILSDAPSCLQFLRSRGGAALGLAADPVGLLTETMLEHAEDHLDRSMSALGAAPGVRCVILTNAGPGSSGRAPGELPLDEGLIDPGLIARLWRAHFDPGLPVLVVGERAESQARWLRGA